MYEYKVKITRVVDGDTVDAEVDLGFDTFIKDRIRLMGIDTPESRTRNKKEKALGLAAKAYLKELLKENKGNIILRTSKEGKGKFAGMVGSLELALPDGKTFNAGSGLTDIQRTEMMDWPPIGQQARIKYEMLSDEGIPLKPTIDLIIE